MLVAAAALGPEWPDAVERPLLALGFTVRIPGVVLFPGGAVRLGAQLTPYPRPVDGGSLREGGVGGVRPPV